jgi:hypothetical protein
VVDGEDGREDNGEDDGEAEPGDVACAIALGRSAVVGVIDGVRRVAVFALLKVIG